NVHIVWYHLLNTKQKLKVYTRLDSFYQRFYKAAKLRYQTGETNKLEFLAAEEQRTKIKFKKKQIFTDMLVHKQELRTLLNTTNKISLSHAPTKAMLSLTIANTDSLIHNPKLALQRQQIELAQTKSKLEKAKLLQDFNVSYALQTIDNQTGYHSFELGIDIPLWFGAQKNKIQAANTMIAIKQKQYEQRKLQTRAKLEKLIIQYKQAKSFLKYYKNQGLTTA